MKISEWFRANLKGAIIVTLILLAALLTAHLVFKTQQDRIAKMEGVYTGRIEVYQSIEKQLELEIKGHKAVSDSLVFRIHERDNNLYKWQKKYSEVSKKYDIERQKIKELPDDSAVGLFLERAECSEFPIIKYGEDYIAPIDAIGFYNVLASDFDQTTEVNTILRGETAIQKAQLDDFVYLVKNKDQQVTTLEEIINNQKKIESERINQLENKDNQLKLEKRQHKITKVVAGFALVAETAVIVALLFK